MQSVSVNCMVWIGVVGLEDSSTPVNTIDRVQIAHNVLEHEGERGRIPSFKFALL